MLVMIMPSQLITGDAPDYELRNATVPDYWTSQSLLSYADTYSHTFNETGGTDQGNFYYLEFTLGGRELEVMYADANFTGDNNHTVLLRHFYTWGWIFRQDHALRWYDTRGYRIDNHAVIWRRMEAMDEYWAGEHSINSSYDYQPLKVECHHFAGSWMFYYNTTLYANVTDAWDHHDLHFWMGLTFDELQTGLNAWDVIGMLLFYEMPDVHWTINAIFKSIIWVMIAYLAFAFILSIVKSLPFT